MNLLAGAQKSIVTAIPRGTTRDVVEETVLAGEITSGWADTAGIRDTDDPVEQAAFSCQKTSGIGAAGAGGTGPFRAFGGG